MRRSWRRVAGGPLAVVLLTAGLVGAWSTAAQAQPLAGGAGLPAGVPLAAGITVSPSGVVDYGFNLAALLGATVSTQAGTRQPDGGCQFEAHGTDRVGDRVQVLMIRTLSLDPAACTRRLATARYDRATMPASAAALLDATPKGAKLQSRTERSDRKAPAGVRPAAATAAWAASLQTFVTFPFLSVSSVTSVQSILSWGNDGSSGHASNWFWSSDWILAALAPQFLNNGVSALTNTLGFYVSNSTCLGYGLNTEHNPAYVEGFFSGLVGWGYRSATGGGPCAVFGSFSYNFISQRIL